ncbi:MAG: amidohydrolase family protein [Clostridia bacterium]
MLAITNTKLILEDSILPDGVLLMDEDRILCFGPASKVNIPADAAIIDAHGNYTAPGFIDVHCHGGNDVFFYEDPLKAAEMFLPHGTTTLLPALYQSMTFEQYLMAIDRIRAVMTQGAGRIIDGFYMEGPFMNPKYGSDANNVKWHGSIDEKVMRELVDYAAGDARVWCVAPERDDIEMFCQYAKQVNPQVVFSMGHTECKPYMAYRLKKYGLRNHTHHCNATAVINPIIPSNTGIRDVGPDEACLYDDDMYAELIADSRGIHVKPHMLRLVVKVKGLDRVILITDHFPSDCANPKGEIMGGTKAPDLGYDEQGWVCGSRMTMDVACRNMMLHTGYGLCHVVKFASLNPARMLGIDDKVGSIEKGKLANLVIIDDMIHVQKVIFHGEIVPE